MPNAFVPCSHTVHFGNGSLKSSYPLFKRKSPNADSCGNEENYTDDTGASTKEHHVQELAVVAADESAGDGASSESTDRAGSEDGAHADPDLSDG